MTRDRNEDGNIALGRGANILLDRSGDNAASACPTSRETPAPSSAFQVAAAPELVRIPAGSFIMGTSMGDKFATDTERPAHQVTFAHRFALGRFPVTVGEYRRFSPPHALHDDPTLPVVNVSWDDAVAYCEWLSAVTDRPFRLPSEAEWECACRAGSDAPFATGHEITTADANFLHTESGERIGIGHRTPVDSYPPNGFELHDLHGNVCEWTGDAWHPDFVGAPVDGRAWIDGGDHTRRVIRGGAWDHLPRLLRCAWRDGLEATAARDNVGFRVALTVQP